jgi:RNA polymerase sigma-70 factor (ECF subfamily)
MSEPIKPQRGLQSASQAFDILAREHHRSLLVFARALSRNDATAADLVQDAFVTAWRNLERFDAARDFGAWLRGIVRNKWREHLRRYRREVDVDDATLEAWESRLASWDAGRQTGSPALFDALDDCLKRLPDTLGEAVNRYYYQDQPGESIAATLGIDGAALRKRLQRAREALRNCLDHKTTTPA